MKYVLILFLFTSCLTKEKNSKSATPNIEITHILQDTTLNIRALDVNENKMVAATSDGRFYKLSTNTNKAIKEINFPNFKKDSLNLQNFRAVAYQGNSLFALTIESPARLYKNGKLVYQENHENSFYDAMQFWNDKEGIAIGDPTETCMSIIITRDKGETWNKISCNQLPLIKNKEAAFAASNSNIAIVGDKTWIATGGASSRILFSPDKGKTWQVYNTPIVQGTETTGMYAVDFYDALNGFAIGGDYKNPEMNTANKISTNDGGKTWKILANNKNPGYRSCVQYLPNGNNKKLVAVGLKGIDYSNDGGYHWKHLSDEAYYTIRFLNDTTAYLAGNGRISKMILKQ